jgi:hypothetical protein
MAFALRAVFVLITMSASANAWAGSATWRHNGQSVPVREDRLAELNALLATAKSDPVAACRKLLPEAVRSGRFENGSSFLTGGTYEESDVVEFLKKEACRCTDEMEQRDKYGSGLLRKGKELLPRAPTVMAPGEFTPADVDTADAATLALVGDSFMYPTAISEAAVQRLPEAIKVASIAVMAKLYVRGEQAVMDTRSNPTKLVGNTWVVCFGETRFTSFSIQRKDGPFFERLLEGRRVEVAAQERSRIREMEEAGRQAKDAQALFAARQTAEYWADELGKKLWAMTAAANQASELETGGYRTLAKEQAWPAARAAEQDLCATIADMRATAPRLVSAARDLLVKDIAYRQGDRPAASAGALLDRRLKGDCILFGR